MSVNLSKGPVWVVAVVVGLIVATALVSGYVDRPGTQTQVAAAEGKCADCPLKGTEQCPKEAGTCPADNGTCPKTACCADSAAATCAQKAACCADGEDSPCTAGAATCAQKAESTATTCPMKAAAAGGCAGGQCPATQ